MYFVFKIFAKQLQSNGLPSNSNNTTNKRQEINVHPMDDEWWLKIKRRLTNLFQICPRVDQKKDKQFVTQLETTAVGECQVSYLIVWDNSYSDQLPRNNHQGFQGDHLQEIPKSSGIHPAYLQQSEMRQVSAKHELCSIPLFGRTDRARPDWLREDWLHHQTNVPCYATCGYSLLAQMDR